MIRIRVSLPNPAIAHFIASSPDAPERIAVGTSREGAIVAFLERYGRGVVEIQRETPTP